MNELLEIGWVVRTKGFAPCNDTPYVLQVERTYVFEIWAIREETFTKTITYHKAVRTSLALQSCGQVDGASDCVNSRIRRLFRYKHYGSDRDAGAQALGLNRIIDLFLPFLRQTYSDSAKSFYTTLKLSSSVVGEPVNQYAIAHIFIDESAGIFLDLAKAYLLKGDLANSRFHLNRWNELRGINYRWLDDFAKEIQEELDLAIPDFLIKSDIKNLNWHLRSYELLQWLEKLATATPNSATRKRIARKLGISTHTLGL